MPNEFDTIQLKRGLLKDWIEVNPILLRGEVGLIFDSETGKPYGYTFGDGISAFNDLPLFVNGTIPEEKIKQLEKSVSVLQTSVAAIQKVIPESASELNKLATLADIFTPTTEQLAVLNSGLTTEKVNELLALESKIPTKTSQLENDGDGISAFATVQKVESHAKAFTYVDETKTEVSTGLDVNGDVILEQEGTTDKSAASRKTAETFATQKASAVDTKLTQHLTNKSNPHNVTKEQIGLGNVSNTSDLDKPISTATKAALDGKQNALAGSTSASSQYLKPPAYLGGAPGVGDLADFVQDTSFQAEVAARKATDASLENKKVDKVENAALLLDSDKEKYDAAVEKLKTIESNAQVNKIEKIQLDGVTLTPDVNKGVNITGVAKASALQLEITARAEADTRLEGLITANTSKITKEISDRTAADTTLDGKITSINKKIPSTASESNQLADKAFVNSSIATNTAHFKGTYDLTESQLVALPWQSINPSGEYYVTENDYLFLRNTTSVGDTVYRRYKWGTVPDSGGTQSWMFEYELNNSSFTAEQWAALNSGITEEKVNQISTNESNIAAANERITENASNISENAQAITALQATSTLLESRIQSNKEDIADLASTKEDIESVKISKWFEAHPTFASPTKIYLQDLDGHLSSESPYAKYLTLLRSIDGPTDFPYSDSVVAICVKKTDETDTTLAYIPTLAKTLKITVKANLITFIIQDLMQPWENVEGNVRDLLKGYCEKSSSAGSDSAALAVWNNDGVAKSNILLASVTPNSATRQGRRYTTFGEAFALTQSLKSYLTPATEGEPINYLESGAVYFRADTDTTTTKEAWAAIEDNTLKNSYLYDNVYLILHQASTTDSVLAKVVFENSTVGLKLFGSFTTGDSNLRKVISNFILKNSVAYLSTSGEKLGTSMSSQTITKATNSRIFVNHISANDLSNVGSLSLTFSELVNSEVDIIDDSALASRFVINKATASKIYLHNKAKITLSDVYQAHIKELEVILCADYDPSISAIEAIIGISNVSKITDLRKPLYESSQYIYLLGASDNLKQLVGPGNCGDWSGTQGNYSATIPFSQHRCGFIKSNPNLYLPKVKTYSLVLGRTAQFEEVYDSASIDISTGQVTVYSNSNSPTYLVVIY